MRILVVDDEGDSADALGVLLSARGHDVAVVHDGRSGIAVGTAEHFDAAVLDLGMAGVDGFEVATALRAHYGATVRLVAYTGFAQASVKQRARVIGFDHLIVKPASIDTIMAAILGLPRRGFDQ